MTDDRLFGAGARLARWLTGAGPAEAPAIEPASPRAVNDLPASPARSGWWHGERFPGGIGPALVLAPDYWTLRALSAQLFTTSLYARGLIRRLVTNEINTGLELEAKPEARLLGYEVDGLADWSETVENRFSLWAQEPLLCDFQERLTFGAIQALARLEALVAGDVLVTLRQDQRTGLQRIQLVNGASVQTPLQNPQRGNEISHGVELDPQGCQAAYWIRQKDGTSKRLPAWGEKSGRRLAWLVYGTDKRLDAVRGEPLLSLVLQAIRELDRYRDATVRKAVVASMLALVVEREQAVASVKPITGGAVRRGTDLALDSTNAIRSHAVAELLPGVVIEDLQQGEKIKTLNEHSTDPNFALFEEALVNTIAWANNIPPETLKLGYGKAYSASQAAVNEFKLYLNVVRTDFGNQFCRPIYTEWLLSEALSRKIDAPRLLEAWRDPKLYDVYSAWLTCDWSGQIKLAVDFSKLVRGYADACREGFITRERATRELTGLKHSKVATQLVRENEAMAEANEPLVRLENSGKEPPDPGSPQPDEEDQGDNEEGGDSGNDQSASVVPLRPLRGGSGAVSAEL